MYKHLPSLGSSELLVVEFLTLAALGGGGRGGGAPHDLLLGRELSGESVSRLRLPRRRLNFLYRYYTMYTHIHVHAHIEKVNGSLIWLIQ